MQEARDLAASRYVMFRLQDKDDDEYRERVYDSLDELGEFTEDREAREEADRPIRDEMAQYDDAFMREFLAKRMEGGAAKWPTS